MENTVATSIENKMGETRLKMFGLVEMRTLENTMRRCDIMVEMQGKRGYRRWGQT